MQYNKHLEQQGTVLYMKLTKALIERAMNLTPADIERALSDNGYEGDKVTTAVFDSLGSNFTFVYLITYPDDETGKEEDAMVFVHYNALIKLVADY